MFLTSHLNKESFDAIKTGQKTIEMRLCKGKYKFVTTGDTIEFINLVDEKQKIEIEVVGVHIYPTFAELYANFDKRELGYLPEETADPKDMEKYYPYEEQLKYCVVGIEIKLKKMCDKF